jgi:hypothetical protein
MRTDRTFPAGRSPQRQIYDDTMSALDAAEDHVYDLGPSEYVALMLEVVRACLIRIENRTGANVTEPWRHDAPLNPEFMGAAKPVAGEDY